MRPPAGSTRDTRPSGPGAIAVDYDVKGAPAGSRLAIVVVDRPASVANFDLGTGGAQPCQPIQ